MNRNLKCITTLSMLIFFFSCKDRTLDIAGPYADKSKWIFNEVKVIDFSRGDHYMKVAIYSPDHLTYIDTAWCMNVAGGNFKIGEKLVGHFVNVLEKDRLMYNGITYPNQILMVKVTKLPKYL